MVAISSRARAQDAAPVVLVATVEPARLSYTAAPGCFDEETFHHAVASFMDKGRDPFDASSPVVLRVTFKKVRGGYRGSLQKVPAKGDPWPEEEWTGATCEGVFREIARMASMRVLGPPKPVQPPPDPVPSAPPPVPALSSEPSKPPPDPVASQAPRVAPAPDASLRPTPPPTPPRTPMDLTLTLSTAFLATAGFTADVGPALQIAGGLRRDWFSFDLEARVVFPSKVYAREPIVPGPTREEMEDVSQVTALAVPCVRFLTYLGGCAVGQLGTMISRGAAGTTDFHLALGVGPRLRAEVPLGDRFAAFGFGEALFPLVTVGDLWDVRGANGQPPSNVRWEQSVVSGFFGAGVLVKFQ
jgi:hypothetical protein